MTVKEPADSLVLSNVFRLGIISLSRTLARELISDNITINNITVECTFNEAACMLLTTPSEETLNKYNFWNVENQIALEKESNKKCDWSWDLCRSPEGFYKIRGGFDFAASRLIAYSNYC